MKVMGLIGALNIYWSKVYCCTRLHWYAFSGYIIGQLDEVMLLGCICIWLNFNEFTEWTQILVFSSRLAEEKTNAPQMQ